MRTLDEFLHPVPVDRFLADHYGRKPLHIPAQPGTERRALLDWAGFNALLGRTTTWTPETLKLFHGGRPVPPEQYCLPAPTAAGPMLRPSAARIEVCLSMGASLVANDVHALTPALAETAAMLGRALGGQVGANLYCSFGGVQAFSTHYDLHEVFAVHLEGEKVWKVYETRAENPIELSREKTRGWLERTRGGVLHEVRMRPGDVLYLPRGWYHDALADGDASLHVSWSITPLHGGAIFSLLEKAAMQDPAFGAWLPSARQDDGRALQAHLADLGRRLAALAAHPQFRDEVGMTQQRLEPREPAFDLPRRKPLTRYRTTGAPPPAVSGPVAVAMGWALSQPNFAIEDMRAQFDFLDVADMDRAVEQAVAAGALARL